MIKEILKIPPCPGSGFCMFAAEIMVEWLWSRSKFCAAKKRETLLSCRKPHTNVCDVDASNNGCKIKLVLKTQTQTRCSKGGYRYPVASPVFH